MIFKFDGSDKNFDSIFEGTDFNILGWQSSIVPPEVLTTSQFDDKLYSELNGMIGGSINDGLSFLANTYLYNTVSAIRITMGQIASTVGFLQSDFNNINNVFKEQSDDIEIVFKVANAILESEFFQKGMDAVGAIPVVGWIIKIVVKVAESIYKIIDQVIKKKIKKTEDLLKAQEWIPLANFDEETDEVLAKLLMARVKNYDIEYLFSPRNFYQKFEDFDVRREKLTDPYGKPYESTSFFNIVSKNLGDRNDFGLGFIPGTTMMDGAMRFPTKACAGVLNSGDFFPTSRNLANSMYQIVQKPGPAMYTVRADKLINRWETSIDTLLRYAEKSIKLGWTCSPTGEIGTNNFICSKDTVGLGYKDCSKKIQIGNIAKLTSDGHYSAFKQYIADLYFDGALKTKTLGKWDPDNIDIAKSTPTQALKILQERQKATLNSLTCLYVGDYIKQKIGNSIPLFPTIYNNSDFKKLWQNNVNALLSTKDEWKRVVFWDIPDGDVKNAIYEKAVKAKLNPNKPGPIDNGLSKIKIPSVLPEPNLPKPFVPRDPPKRIGKNQTSSTSKKSNSSIAVPAAIAAGAAFFFLKP